MLYYNFDNAEEFDLYFGFQDHNGKKCRKNKILLAFLKNKQLLHQARVSGDYSLLWILSMGELKSQLMNRIQENGSNLDYKVNIINYKFGSNQYETDKLNGLCEDGDIKCIRYINKKNGKVYKMKAGKFLRALIMETEYGELIGEQAIGYLCEEFARDWETYAMGVTPKNSLTVSQEFAKIYSSKACVGDFHSCMVNRGLHTFYEDSVEASAAYLTNEKGQIIARCIIYNEVEDEDGEDWRLAERQYSSDNSDVLKRALVDALIREGRIDGYKLVGAGCSDANSFVDINGNSLADKKFSIRCEIDTDDPLSYQDSFKWYDITHYRAYNYPDSSTVYNLDVTEGSINGEENNDEENYDEYHEEYTYHNTIDVMYHGDMITCDEMRLQDFEWIESENIYYHKDDVSKCPYCDSYFPTEKGYHSDLLDKDYCCEEDCNAAEYQYKDENWYWSDFDKEYYEHETDVVHYKHFDSYYEIFEDKTIHKNTLKELFVNGRMYRYQGEYYDAYPIAA